MKKLYFLTIFFISIGLFNIIESKELEVAWETEAKFELPESVIFDPKRSSLCIKYS